MLLPTWCLPVTGISPPPRLCSPLVVQGPHGSLLMSQSAARYPRATDAAAPALTLVPPSLTLPSSPLLPYPHLPCHLTLISPATLTSPCHLTLTSPARIPPPLPAYPHSPASPSSTPNTPYHQLGARKQVLVPSFSSAVHDYSWSSHARVFPCGAADIICMAHVCVMLRNLSNLCKLFGCRRVYPGM